MALFGRKKTTVGLDIGSGLDQGRRDRPLEARARARRASRSRRCSPTRSSKAKSWTRASSPTRSRRRSAARGVTAKDVVTAVGGRDVIIKKISDRAREGAAGARADALGSGAARAVRHGVGGAGFPDPRSRRRRRGDERAARRRQARADRVEGARAHRCRPRARRSSTSKPSRCTTRSRSIIPTR